MKIWSNIVRLRVGLCGSHKKVGNNGIREQPIDCYSVLIVFRVAGALGWEGLFDTVCMCMIIQNEVDTINRVGVQQCVITCEIKCECVSLDRCLECVSMCDTAPVHV